MESQATKQTVIDNYGKEYTLVLDDSDNFLVLKLYRLEQHVGHAHCNLDISTKRMLLCDIEIFKEADRKGIDAFWAVVKREPDNYHRRGLGNKLLQVIIECAQRLGAVEIYGHIVEKDLVENPSLLHWYRKHGFEVTEVKPIDTWQGEKPPRTVAMVCHKEKPPMF
jgi:GNAT superfamily N-acetyltransferase